MTKKTISKMTEDGALITINDICDGLKEFFQNNPEGAKIFLDALVTDVLSPLAEEDFFGTEGWEVGLGIEE